MTTGPQKRSIAPWVAIALTVLAYLATFFYQSGRQTERLDSIDKRLGVLEQVLIEKGSRAEMR